MRLAPPWCGHGHGARGTGHGAAGIMVPVPPPPPPDRSDWRAGRPGRAGGPHGEEQASQQPPAAFCAYAAAVSCTQPWRLASPIWALPTTPYICRVPPSGGRMGLGAKRGAGGLEDSMLPSSALLAGNREAGKRERGAQAVPSAKTLKQGLGGLSSARPREEKGLRGGYRREERQGVQEPPRARSSPWSWQCAQGCKMQGTCLDATPYPPDGLSC